MECAPRLPGCGTQHPHRALGGTRVLLAAAPTTPPCFRRWRRSSLLQRKNYFYFGIQESLRTFLNPFFTGGIWNELPQSKPDGFASSLGEGASGVSANFVLQPETVPSCQGPHPRGRLPPLRGKMSRSDKKGNLSPQATGGVFPAASSPHPPPKALRIGGGCAIIYYIHYRALRKGP